MDRNREARRAAATSMAAPSSNGLPSRRRHRTNTLSDSPDEYEGGMEVQESGERLRERSVVKKGLDQRERLSRSKRRRENRDEGDDTFEESVNDEDDVRMLPPQTSNNHHSNSNSSYHPPQQNQLHQRKSFPPVGSNKVFRTAVPPLPARKAADEMIGVSVPRKARSASTKRSHEWISGGVVGGGDLINRQSSASPVRLASSVASPVAAPPSPSSNVSKANGGGSKPRPPKSSSSNPEELEIEIAEVLYGLMTQSQAPAKKGNDSAAKFGSNKLSSDNKSRVSSPISNSTVLPQNSTSLSTHAPKRKRTRQVSENQNPFSVRNSRSSIKTENDQSQNHHQNHNQSPKTDSSGSAAPYVCGGENGVSFGFTSVPGSLEPKTMAVEEEAKCGVGGVLTKEEIEKRSPAVGLLGDGKSTNEALIMTAAASMTATNLKNAANLESEGQKEEKFKIDLMAPPPQQKTSPERDNGNIGFPDHKQQKTTLDMSKNFKNKEDDKLRKIGKDATASLTDELKKSKTGIAQEAGGILKQSLNEEKNVELRIDLEKPNKDSGTSMVSSNSNRSLDQVLKHQQLSAKSETHSEKTAQPSSMPMPMSMANWPPMGYVAQLQGVISMDGHTMPSTPVQPIFTQPRPKRCATHCYIARNIHYLQQFMKINPFWRPASGSAPMFGAKPHNLNVMSSAELHRNSAGGPLQAMQDKGQGLAIFAGQNAGKDTKSAQATTVPDPTAQKKQPVMLQQAMPPVAPNNILHGPAFIFPFNQQEAVAASASVRPGSSKLNTSTAGGLAGASGAANSASVSALTTAAAPALSFNYPSMSANETQYLAILQNNPYPFPIPAIGGPPNYRGNPHAQSMPLFNGSFYSSQIIPPSQIPQPPHQQQAQPTQSQNHHPSQSQQLSQTHQNSSGFTSSSQKHLQAQQRQQGSGAALNGSGNRNCGSLHNSYPGHKNRSQQPSQHLNPPPQARHLENEITGGEDSPSTADSRVSRAASTMRVYGHNFAMPVHSQNFGLMNPQGAMSNAPSGNSNDKKQQQHQQQQSQQQHALKRGGVEPPQTFAMSFTPINGTTGTISSMAQNHAMFQNLPESLRQSYHHMMAVPAVAAASAHHSQQKKDIRISDDTSRTATGHDSSSADDDRKCSSGMTTKSGQSIAFSRPDLASDAANSSGSIPVTSVIDSSSRNINLGADNQSSGSPIPTSVTSAQSSHHLHAQFQQQQQQQVLQLQKQQQQQNQNMNARNKNPPTSNGSAYPDHLMTASSLMAGKFTNSPSSFPLQTTNASSSPVQSPQWRNSVRGGPTPSQVPSSLASATTSSLKNIHQAHQSPQVQQQQSSRPHSQSHTQISFGAASQKLPSTTPSQMQQQSQSQNPGSNSSNQSPSPPMLVGSPTTSSMSKGGAAGSPRINPSASTSGRMPQASSLSSSQQAKNSHVGTQRSSPSPSIHGNPHMTNSNPTKSQQQQQQQNLPKQTLQQKQQAQAHLFFTHPYMQVQQSQAQQHSGGSTTASGTSGYYLPRKPQNQQSEQQQNQQNQQQSSTSMLSLSQPVTMASTTTSDPAKAIAAATGNMKGGAAPQGHLHAALVAQMPTNGAAQSTNAGHQLLPGSFPQYVHNAPAAVQVKPAEQKQQPAGE